MKLKLNISPVKSVKLQLDLLFNYSDKEVLNTTELTFLAYLAVYGYNEGKERVYDDGLSLNKQVWTNHMYKFRKMGIIEGKKEKTVLNPKIIFSKDNLEYKLDINVESD